MSRSAVVAGASGLVGGLLLEELLAAPDYARVTALVRTPLPREHAKLAQEVVNFGDPRVPAADDAFCCLGTTRAKAGSAEAFRAVDFDAVVAFARSARASGAKRFLLVSSSGADARSPFLYPRVKGEAEQAVSGLGFETVAILRPSLLLGPRAESRPAEHLAQLALGPLRALIPARWRPIEAATVARAMRRWALTGAPGVCRLENDKILAIGHA